MSVQQKLLAGCLALAGLLAAPRVADAQDFALAVSASPNPVVVSNTLTYTIYATNRSGFARDNVFVTNMFSDGVLFTGVSSSTFNATPITTSNSIVFHINTIPSTVGGNVEQLVLTFVPLVTGALTNQVTVLAAGRDSVTTNIIAQVNQANADLALFMTNAASGVLAGDSTTISMMVTNLGPASASGIFVTNTLPLSFNLLSVSPAGVSNFFGGGNLVLSLGTLASGSSTQMLVSVRPTNGGAFTLTASVTVTNVVDSNLTNNAVTNSMTVGQIVGASLTVTNVTTQQYNPQTGLMEEIVRVTNGGTNDAPSVRLNVSGLGTNWMYNAVGTNNGNPYVLYGARLAASNYVDLRLEYFVWNRTALTNLTRTAVAVDLTSVPTPTGDSSPVIKKIELGVGTVLIEFQSVPNRSYTILYADNLSFSNALAAQPAVTAIADRVQWIDNGPPKTISNPSNTSSRLYRVLLNP